MDDRYAMIHMLHSMDISGWKKEFSMEKNCAGRSIGKTDIGMFGKVL